MAEAPSSKTLGVRLLIRATLLAAAFAVLMVCAYLIPDALVEQNVRASARFLNDQGLYPQFAEGDNTTHLDNWTDAIVVNMCVHQEGDPLRSAFLNPYYENELCETDRRGEGLLQSIEEGIGREANCHYGRYWQGYLSYIRPLLCVMDLRGIRMVSSFVLIVLIIGAVRAAGVRLGRPFALALILSLVLVKVWVVPLSIKFLPSFAVGLAVLWRVLGMRDEELLSDNLALLLFSSGAVTVFLDFLSTPLVSLLVPLAAAALAIRDRLEEMGMRAALAWAGRNVGAWLLGYLGFGILNWVIYTLVSSDSVAAIETITTRFDHWVFTTRSEGIFSGRLAGLFSVAYWLVGGWITREQGPAVAAIILCSGVAALYAGRKRLQTTRILLIVLAALPCLWYIVLVESVAVHSAAVYRTMVCSLFPAFSFAILSFSREG